MTDITDHLAIIERRVAHTLAACDRDNDPFILLAVSKGQPVESIAKASQLGIVNFGENYVDEAVQKISDLRNPALRWHFIGRVQSNKTRLIAEHFDWVHTLDRMRIAERLNAQRAPQADPLNVLIQLNLESEPQKAGIGESDLVELIRCIDELPRLKLRGFMTIPPAMLPLEELTAHFCRVRDLGQKFSTPSRRLDTLSMGMSKDFETAIRCGSTCIRVGTALFGPRPTRGE